MPFLRYPNWCHRPSPKMWCEWGLIQVYCETLKRGIWRQQCKLIVQRFVFLGPSVWQVAQLILRSYTFVGNPSSQLVLLEVPTAWSLKSSITQNPLKSVDRLCTLQKCQVLLCENIVDLHWVKGRHFGNLHDMPNRAFGKSCPRRKLLILNTVLFNFLNSMGM